MKATITTLGIQALLCMVLGCGGGTTQGPGGGGGTSQRIEVRGDLMTSATWTADKIYVLKEPVFVMPPAVLTIEAGTSVLGDNGSVLVVTRGARLEAIGTAQKPIVFTSSKPVGSRNAGDWGGVVLLGRAPINVPGGENAIEGLPNLGARSTYGGTDANDSSGSLKYVRIEFAGFLFGDDNELNGLTCGGCGAGTTIDYVHVHRGLDDGVELFGGTVNIRHIVVTLAADDGLDWDLGWVGKAQYLVVLQDGVTGNNAYEADNNPQNNDASPRSQPFICNATLVGANLPAGAPPPPEQQRGMVLRRGTGAKLFNHIVMGFGTEAIDVRDRATTAMTPAGLHVKNSLFFANGSNGNQFDPNDDATSATGTPGTDDGLFDEKAFFQTNEATNRFSSDPMLTDPYNKRAPNWMPRAGSPALAGAATTPVGDAFFDQAGGSHIGAFGTVDWTAGWTAYPEN